MTKPKPVPTGQAVSRSEVMLALDFAQNCLEKFDTQKIVELDNTANEIINVLQKHSPEMSLAVLEQLITGYTFYLIPQMKKIAEELLETLDKKGLIGLKDYGLDINDFLSASQKKNAENFRQ